MIEQGYVIRSDSGVVDVRVDVSDACASCGACDATGAGAMIMREVADPLGASIGDRVEIEVPDGTLSRGALLGYGLPVLALVGGYLAGLVLSSGLGSDPDVTGAIVGVAASAIVAVLLFRGRVSIMSSQRFAPRVHAIIRRSVPS